MLRWSWVLLLVLAAGCAQPHRGRVDPGPPLTGQVFARSGVGQPNGLRVLHYGPSGGFERGDRAWIAADDVELEAVWHRVGIRSDPPPVDFTQDVAFVFWRDGGACEPPIIGFRADTSGQLFVEYDMSRAFQTCIMIGYRIAEIILVPRRMLPTKVVYLWGFRFLVEPPPV